MASDFKSAFASARKAGKKEFTWNGKSYNTELKGSVRPKARAAVAADVATGPMPRPKTVAAGAGLGPKPRPKASTGRAKIGRNDPSGRGRRGL